MYSRLTSIIPAPKQCKEHVPRHESEALSLRVCLRVWLCVLRGLVVGGRVARGGRLPRVEDGLDVERVALRERPEARAVDGLAVMLEPAS